MGPTESPKVISFEEKHHQKILRENKDLKTWLYEILEVAQVNQRIQEDFEAMERRILKSRSLREMARILVREIKKRFQVDHVTICLALDQEDVLYKAQIARGRRRAFPQLRIMDPVVLQEALPKRIRGPVLKGPITQESSPFFSSEEMAEIRSKAVVPLYVSNKLMGTLNIGSRDPNRYTSAKATDLLGNLGWKISLVMDNILTRQRLRELSVTDQLTGTANRRCFDEALGLEVERARRYETPLACIGLALDNFKEIVDCHGRETGDHALQYVADLLKSNIRQHDTVARHGAQFSILLPHTTLEGALRVVDKYGSHLSGFPFAPPAGQPITLGLSAGIAAMPGTPVRKPQDLKKEAERRLDLAKEKGGGQVISTRET